MKIGFKSGFSFGLTSGIITTLGLMVGLQSGTHSKPVIIGGILTIAVADAFSDALGMHFSQESEKRYTTKELWGSAVATFFTKFIVALTFMVPIMLLSLNTAVVLSVIWGLSLLGIFSFHLARVQKIRPWKIVIEHWAIALAVILITRYVGAWIGSKVN